MTIEHIIPLLRGGTNDFENLTILCYDCNQLKGNLLYLPNGFYSALRNKPRYTQMQNYMADWFQSIKEEFDVERYPLISPSFYMQIDPTMNSGYRKVPFRRSGYRDSHSKSTGSHQSGVTNRTASSGFICIKKSKD